MTSNHEASYFNIDLNNENPHQEIDNGNVQPQNANEVYHLPDLNINAVEEIDLNIIPNSPLISSEEHFVYDLNVQPFDTYLSEDVSEHIVSNQSLEGSYEENYTENNNAHEDIGLEPEEYDYNERSNIQALEIPKIRKSVSNTKRRMIYEALLEKSVDGKLEKGVTKLVASQFSVHIRSVQRIWKLAENKGVHADVSNKKVGNCGRKRVQVDFDRVRNIPLNKRTTIRDLSFALNMSRSTVSRCVKSKDIRRHSNAIKPSLTEENKKGRLQFCLSMLDSASIDHDPIFKGLYNTVHIDEKWFYMKEKSKNFYLLQDEEEPIRTCKSKKFIPKVMFLVAIARPRFDVYGNEIFSGKIGVFPFITQEPARRSSVNRPAGTLETKPIQSVNKDVIRKYLLEKVLPAIKEKWPREEMGQPIFIQQDNAKTHIDGEDEEFRRIASQDGFDIRLMRQPPNSPDLNVLDLGFFSSIQTLQHKESPNSIDELVDAVERSFQAFETTKSNRIFLTFQSCMIEIMKAKGSHNYRIPHLNKEKLETRNQLPTNLKCDIELVQEIRHYLNFT